MLIAFYQRVREHMLLFLLWSRFSTFYFWKSAREIWGRPAKLQLQPSPEGEALI